MAVLFAGGEAIIDSSFSAPSAIFNDLGIGVAVMVSMSLCPRIFFSDSFCLTPKRCSSSIIINPKFLYSIVPCINLWVPMIISIFPSLSSDLI